MTTETLFVFVDTGFGDVVVAGQFTLDHQDDGALKRGGRFKYANSYKARPDAFPLDPIHLPLNDEIHFTPLIPESGGIFGVLHDAGPDAWGKQVLSLCHQPTLTTPVDFLLASGGHGVGAVRFSDNAKQPPPLPLSNIFETLNDIHEAADLIVAGKAVDQAKLQHFAYGNSLGGARPKSQIWHEGANWIAKFDRADDPFSICRAEYVCMQVAREAGIDVADVRLEETARGPVLLVRRFDQEDKNQHHMISFSSTINARGQPRWEAAKAGTMDSSYSGLATIARQISSAGASAAEEVFRRMLFNVVVGNTDDHVQNHAFMKRAGESDYALSPAFDIVPNPNMVGSHAIGLGGVVQNPNTPSLINISSATQRMGIDAKRATEIAAEVIAATDNLENQLNAAGMANTVGIAKCFQMRNLVMRFARGDR